MITFEFDPNTKNRTYVLRDGEYIGTILHLAAGGFQFNSHHTGLFHNHDKLDELKAALMILL